MRNPIKKKKKLQMGNWIGNEEQTPNNPEEDENSFDPSLENSVNSSHFCYYYDEIKFEHELTHIVISNSGKYLFCSDKESTFYVFDTLNFNLVLKDYFFYQLGSVVITDEKIISASFSEECIIEVKTINDVYAPTYKIKLREAVNNMILSPDEKKLLFSTWDYGSFIIQVRDPISLYITGKMAGHQYDVSAIKCTPDLKYIISSTFYPEVKVWDYNTYQCISTLTFDCISIETFKDSLLFLSNKIVFSDLEGNENGFIKEDAHFIFRERNFLVAGKEDGEIKVWDLETRCLMETIKLKKKEMHSMVNLENRFFVCENLETLKIFKYHTPLEIGGIFKKQYSVDLHFIYQ